MKGLKEKMSIKAFCKRGLAVMLACAMVATSLPALNVRADETTDAGTESTVMELVDFASSDETRAILVKNAKANSEQNPASGSDGTADWAFDGADHFWHSRYSGTVLEGEAASGDPARNPIWIQSGFDKVWAVKEVRYEPRGNGNNIIKDYEIQIACLDDPTATPSDSDFVTVKSGTMLKQNDKQTVDLGAYYRATHVRIYVTSSQSGNGSVYLTAKTIEFWGTEIDSAATVTDLNYDFSKARSIYKQGEEISLTGITHEEVYSDGTNSIPISGAAYTATGYEASQLGEQAVTVSCDDFDGIYNVSVVEVKKFENTAVLVKNAKANSEQNPVSSTDGTADWAFDEIYTHWWHSRYSGTVLSGEVANGNPASNPIWIQSGFDKPWEVREVHYAPRTGGNNIVANYSISIANMNNPLATPSDSDFVTVKTGTMTNTTNEQTIDLGRFYTATHVRMTITSKQGGGSVHVTARLISFYGTEAVIENPEVAGVMITSEAEKKTYYTGDELDLTGLEVIKVYNDGTTEIISDYEVTGFNSSVTTTQAQTLTITYGEFSTSYGITMIGAGTAQDDRRDYDVNKLTYRAGSQHEGNNGSTGDGRIAWAFDNNLLTWWHSHYNAQWSDEAGTTRADYLWVEMTFAEPTVVDAIRYLPRNGNGDITGYQILGSTDGETWNEITTGTWTRSGWQIAEFTPVELKAVKLVATASHGDSWASAAEIRVREVAIADTINLYVEDIYEADVAAEVEVRSANSEIATAEKVDKVVGVETALHDHATSGNGFSETAGSAKLADAEFTFTQNGNYWQVNNKNQWIRIASASSYFGNEAADLIVETVDSTSGTYRIKAVSGSRYAIFLNTTNVFDAYATNNVENTMSSDTRLEFDLVLLEKQDVVSEDDRIPGYRLATSLTSGKNYLIGYELEEDLIVLYPTNKQVNQTKKVGATSDIINSQMIVTGIAEGKTHVFVGDDIYEVVVTIPRIIATAGSVRDNGALGTDGKPEKDPCRMLDGNRDNNWLSDPNDAIADSWVNFELPRVTVVDGLKLYYGAGGYVHKAYEVLVSMDGENWTKVCEGTFAQAAGEKTIKFKPVETKHIRLVPTEKYNSEFAIWEAEILYPEVAVADWFVGASMRMDYTDTFDKTCLRFEYKFPTVFNGMTVDADPVDVDGDTGSWKWFYKAEGNDQLVEMEVADKKWTEDPAGTIKSNIVFTNIGRTNYGKMLYTQLAVTYSDGSNTLTVYDSVIAERSVNKVANAIKDAYKDAVDENKIAQYNYALGILGESAQ